MVVSVSGYVFTCCCLGWRLDVWLNVFFTCCCLGGRLSVWLGIFLPVVVLVHGCQCVWVFSYLLLSWWLVVSVLGVFFFGLLLSWWEVVSVVGCVLTCICLGERLSVWFKVFLPVVVWVGGCQCVFHLLLSLWIFVYFYLLLSWWVIVSVFFTVAVIVIFCLLELTCCCLGGFVCYLPVIVLWSFCLFLPVVVWVCFYLSLSLWSFVYFSLPVVVWVCFYLSLSLWSFVYFSLPVVVWVGAPLDTGASGSGGTLPLSSSVSVLSYCQMPHLKFRRYPYNWTCLLFIPTNLCWY